MAVTVEQVRALAMALPEATEEVTWGTALNWRVNGKIFAIGAPDSPRLSVKASKEDQAELIASEPETFSSAAYVGRFGWVSVVLANIDADELGGLLVEAWRRTAPKRLVKAYDTEHAGS